MANEPQLRHGNIWGQPIALQSVRTNPFNNDVSTTATIMQMRGLAHRYASDPLVMQATGEALSGGVRSWRDVACAIFYWIRHVVRFVEDETLMYEQFGIQPQHLDKELLIIPPVLLAMPQPMGDCDDYSLLMASMLLCAGLRPYWVTVAADAEDHRKFSHIYVCVYLPDEGTHMHLDPGNRLPMVPPGWEESKVTRKAIWAV
jgi:transglutaminase-like putative cysteine protease